MYQLRKLTKRFLERFRTNIEDPTTRTVVKNCVRDWFSWEARGTKKAKSPESDSPSEMLVSAGDQPEGQRTGDSWVLVRGNVASDWGLAYLRPTLTTGLPSSSRCGMYEVRSYFSCLSYYKSEEEKISMRWGKQRVESVMLGWLSTVTVGQKKHQRQNPDGGFISSMCPSLILLAHSHCYKGPKAQQMTRDGKITWLHTSHYLTEEFEDCGKIVL